jgi:hypothetical protein
MHDTRKNNVISIVQHGRRGAAVRSVYLSIYTTQRQLFD